MARVNLNKSICSSVQSETGGLTSAELSLFLTQLKQKHKIRKNKMQRQIDGINFQVKVFFQNELDFDLEELKANVNNILE
jgi:hypothetical protein